MTIHEEAREMVKEQTNSSRKWLQQYIDDAEFADMELDQIRDVVFQIKRYFELFFKPKTRHEFDEFLNLQDFVSAFLGEDLSDLKRACWVRSSKTSMKIKGRKRNEKG